MNWMTILWPMVCGACLTLALINLWIATGEEIRLPRIFFSLCALSAAAVSGFELALMTTTDLARYDEILRWAVLPVGIMFAAVGGFIWSFFGTGRTWLLVAALLMNESVNILNLFTPEPVIRHAVALHQVETLGGAHFTMATTVNSPLNAVQIIGNIILTIYMVDASLSVWKRGGKRRAVVVGGSFVLCLIVARGDAILIDHGLIHTPYLVSIAFVGVLIAMGSELSAEVWSAARMARKLSESEQSMSLAAEAANLGMWIWDAGRDEIWMTETGRKLLGFEANTPLNYATFQGRVHPDDRMARSEAITQALATNGTYSIEYRALLPDGKIRWMSSRGGVLDAGKGKKNRLLGVSMDITAQKEAELRITKQRDEIAHLGRISMMGQLSTAITHELKQPLGTILRNSEAAAIYLKSDSPDLAELRAIVDDIQREDEHAIEVMERLRGLLRHQDIGLTPLDIGELVEKVIVIVRPDFVSRQVLIRTEIAPDLPTVMADRVHIQQVMLNLIINAMDAMRDIAPVRRQLTVGVHRKDEKFVEIYVRDRGHGIAPEKLAHIFEPFFTTKSQGMGMGLAISQTIIDAHQGTIWAESAPDSGATFRFTLTVQPQVSD
jgi:PAS domain S-box-containing protein